MSAPLSNIQLNQVASRFQDGLAQDSKSKVIGFAPLEGNENKGAFASVKPNKRLRQESLKTNIGVDQKITRAKIAADLISKAPSKDMELDSEVAVILSKKANAEHNAEQRETISKTPGSELTLAVKSRTFDLKDTQHAQIVEGLQNFSGSPIQGMPKEVVIDSCNKILEIALKTFSNSAGTDVFVRHKLSLGNKEVNLKVKVTHQDESLNLTVRYSKQQKFGGALKIFHKAVFASLANQSVQVINAADLTTKAVLGIRGIHLLRHEEKILSFIHNMLLEKKREDLEFPKIHEFSCYRSAKGPLKARVIMGLFHFGDLFDVIGKKVCPPNSPFQNEPIKMWKENDQWALKLAISIAESVAFLHEIGLVHLDLKPDNILMCGKEGEEMKPKAMVGDFDTARFYEKPGYHRINAGTIDFMSPQQLKFNTTENIQPEDKDNLKPPADVWSLGVIYFIMVSNRYPLWGSLVRLYFSLSETGMMIKQSGPKKSENRTPLNINNEKRLKDFGELLLKNVDPKEYAAIFTASQFNDVNSVFNKIASKENAYHYQLNNILMSIRQSLSEGVDKQVFVECVNVMKIIVVKHKMVYEHLRNADVFADPVLNLIQKMLQPDIDKRITIEEVVLSLKALL